MTDWTTFLKSDRDRWLAVISSKDIALVKAGLEFIAQDARDYNVPERERAKKMSEMIKLD